MTAEKRVQVKIEFGHQAISKENPTNKLTHDWTVFVKGVEGADISHIVEKVVFHLHQSFPKPKRVCKEPPYKLSESGYGSFTLPIEVFFKTTAKEDPRKVMINYELTLHLLGLPPLNHSKIEALTFLNPSDEFEKRLLKAGAIILASEETNKVKNEKSPPNSTNDSPNQQKKSSSQHVAKIKKELSHATKRSAEDISTPKQKKKKVDKHDHNSSSSTTPNGGGAFKEISILKHTNENDPLKAKSMNSVRKLKEERARRKSVENSESPKHSSKEIKHKSKVKKEKIHDSGVIPKIKVSIKRTPNESWATTVKDGTVDGNTDNSTNTTTTAAQQNDHVKKVMAEFAQQESSGEEENATEESSHIDHHSSIKVNKKQKTKPSLGVVSHNMKNTKSSETQPRKLRETGKKMPSASSPSLSREEMNELYVKLNDEQDEDVLQAIVDIVESSGQYVITTSTFDFDLCLLEGEILSSIKNVLDKTC